MSLISPLPTTSVDAQDKRGILTGVTNGWRNFFFSVFNVCSGVTQSGTTAQRPADGLWVGRPFFDTTLGLPIFYKGPGWVTAAGAPA